MDALTENDVIAHDHQFRTILDRADTIARFDSHVLITGETGTGKELLAQRIHRKSRRSDRKLVPINCGSLPDALIETELFGSRKGAYTGAIDRKGLADEADGGILFLDEVGEMPLELQSRFLRFLDTGEVRAVGSTRPRRVDVRVVAATNRPLVDEVGLQRFRLDLYHRLAVVCLHLPPLRERPEDIVPIATRHLQRIATRNCQRDVPALSEALIELLTRHAWPGNVRELQNAIEHAFINCCGDLLRPEDLPPSIAGAQLPLLLERPEARGRADLAATIARCGGHKKAAKCLGISRTTLWRRLKEA